MNWISVKEMVPPPMNIPTVVILQSMLDLNLEANLKFSGKLCLAFYEHGNNCWKDWETNMKFRNDEVIFWLPLPSIPDCFPAKEENEMD